jgi:hypothetical protein
MYYYRKGIGAPWSLRTYNQEQWLFKDYYFYDPFV